MPVISRFYGIVIFMNFRDHELPHFHARLDGAPQTGAYARLGKGQSKEKPG